MKAFLLKFLATCLYLQLITAQIPTNFNLKSVERKSRDEIDAQVDAELMEVEEAIETISGHLDEIQKLIDGGFPANVVSESETGTGNEEEEEETEYETEVEDHEFPVYVIPYTEKFTTGQVHRENVTERIYIGYVEETADDISGMCASRVHPGIMYFLNDNTEYESYIYAVDIEDNCKIKSRIELSVVKDEWEDMACAPCGKDSEDFCIYIIDDHDGNNFMPEMIYKIREPEDLQMNINYTVEDDEIIYFYSYLDSIQTLMVDPNGRIFVMDKTSEDFTIYEVKNDMAEPLFDVAIWTYYSGPVGGDISSDGTGWLFKMYDRVYYFYVESDSLMETILSDSDNREKMPYLEEVYGTTVAWSPGNGSFLTASEGASEPWYRYYRVY